MLRVRIALPPVAADHRRRSAEPSERFRCNSARDVIGPRAEDRFSGGLSSEEEGTTAQPLWRPRRR